MPINTATNKAGKAVNIGALDAEFQDIAITPNSKTVYAVGGTGVIPINTRTDKAGKATTVAGAFAIAITPNGKTAYVASFSQPGAVIPINTATNKAGRAIPAGVYPFAIAITPGREDRLRRQSRLEHSDADRHRHQQSGQGHHRGAGPYTIAITPNGKTAYVANSFSATVTPINTTTDKAGKAITVGDNPQAIAITP